MRTSLRKVLNITYEWLMEAYQFRQDDWDQDWAPLFDPDHGTFDLAAETDGKIG